MITHAPYKREVSDEDNELTEVRTSGNRVRVVTNPMVGRPVWLTVDQARELHEALGEALWLADQWKSERDEYSGKSYKCVCGLRFANGKGITEHILATLYLPESEHCQID